MFKPPMFLNLVLLEPLTLRPYRHRASCSHAYFYPHLSMLTYCALAMQYFLTEKPDMHSTVVLGDDAAQQRRINAFPIKVP